jgi:ornithine cyclodeaminase
MTCPVFGPEEVRSLLDYDGCIAVVREAMTRLSADAVNQPLRSIFEVAPGKLLAVMPGMLSAPGGVGAKLITAYPEPGRAGRSAHRGIVVLFDRVTGVVQCIGDAGEITQIRTASASAVATDALARADARRLAIFGYGTQAAAHVRAIKRVRALTEVVVWGRSIDSASEFAAHMAQETELPIRAVADAEEAAQMDIICTVTSSATPVLKGRWVRPGTHINAVGSSYAGPTELDSELVVKSRYIADSRNSALAAAAEFLIAKQAGLIGDSHIVAEIGEVLLGRVPGRTSTDEITLYKSLGHVVQDLAALTYIYERTGPNSGKKPPGTVG